MVEDTCRPAVRCENGLDLYAEDALNQSDTHDVLDGSRRL